MSSHSSSGRGSSFHEFRFGVLNIRLINSVGSLEPRIEKCLGAYAKSRSGESFDLQVEVSSTAGVEHAHLGRHWDYKDGWAGRFGHFFMQRWHLSDETPKVVCAIARSPLAPLRPILDYEMHTAAQDIGKFLHESILIPATLLLKAPDAVVFHGATLRAPDGHAILITGRGGVGKTSIALELRREEGWSFISDDLVPVDSRGVAYLNAAWPKVYAYNVIEDRHLEDLVLRGRSMLNQVHWRVFKRWPERVRRSVPPDQLFGEVAMSARLGQALWVERHDIPRVTCRQVSPEEVARVSVDILESELARFGNHLSLHQASQKSKSRNLVGSASRWDSGLWQQAMNQALAAVDTYKIEVPISLSALEYRREMRVLIAKILSGL